MDKTLQELAERYLCSAITPAEWQWAKAEAAHKLAFIIDQEGDNNGIRQEPWYLARLIAEAVGLERFSEALRELAKGQRVKKDSPRQNAEPSPYQPYCSTAGTQMQ